MKAMPVWIGLLACLLSMSASAYDCTRSDVCTIVVNVTSASGQCELSLLPGDEEFHIKDLTPKPGNPSVKNVVVRWVLNARPPLDRARFTDIVGIDIFNNSGVHRDFRHVGSDKDESRSEWMVQLPKSAAARHEYKIQDNMVVARQAGGPWNVCKKLDPIIAND